MITLTLLWKNINFIQPNKMETKELKAQIKYTKSIKDKEERLEELRLLTEEIANQFTFHMSLLENEIEFVLDRTPDSLKRELNYFSVSDITQNIVVRSSGEW